MAEPQTITIERPTQTMTEEIVHVPSETTQVSITHCEKIMDESGAINYELLTQEQKDHYKKLSSSLVTKDINSIMNFGSDLQNSLQGFGNDFLKSVRLSKTGELGEEFANLLVEINGVDIDGIKDSSYASFLRKIPILRSLAPSIEKRLAKYDMTQSGIEKYEKKINSIRLLAQRDNNALSVMFEQNVQTLKNLEEIIIAGKLKLEELKHQLEDMLNHRNEYEDYQIQDLQEYINNLEKRISDLFAQYYTTKLSLPQIRVVQYGNVAIANNAASLVSTTLPIWRAQLTFAVALYNQKKSVEAEKKIKDFTNKAMVMNANSLKENSLMVAAESQRGVVSIETLRDVTSKLVETIKESKAIAEEGARKRKEAEAELLKLGGELTSAMTEITDNSSRLYLS